MGNKQVNRHCIRLKAGSNKQINDLLKITSAYTTDFQLEFDLEKCKILNMEREKEIHGDAEHVNEEIIRALEIGEIWPSRRPDRPSQELGNHINNELTSP